MMMMTFPDVDVNNNVSQVDGAEVSLFRDSKLPYFVGRALLVGGLVLGLMQAVLISELLMTGSSTAFRNFTASSLWIVRWRIFLEQGWLIHSLPASALPEQ